MRQPKLLSIVSVLQPFFLLAGFLCYSLGAGIAHYLGNLANWQVYWLGQVCVTLLQLMMIFGRAYFDALISPISVSGDLADPQNTRFRFSRQQSLLALSTTMTAGAALTTLLVINHVLNPNTITILSISFLLAFFYAAPPTRWAYSGYGEIITAVLLSNLIPAFAFLLQTGEVHRLLAMTTFPLTLLYIAMGLAQALPTYAVDMKRGYHTLIQRIGWKLGMGIHNLLILAAFFLLVISLFLGMPWSIAWPALFVLPVGLYQIYQIYQISMGMKPNWDLLNLTALATFSLLAYLLTFGFWLG
jgi:1,4-dihydroxy-2-naphthoate octaprenyltransferase